MNIVMEEEIKRWTARRKSALVLEIIQGKTSVSEGESAVRFAAVGDRELGRRRQAGHGKRAAG
jgi:hypothetical protein